eukprot:UN10261
MPGLDPEKAQALMLRRQQTLQSKALREQQQLAQARGLPPPQQPQQPQLGGYRDTPIKSTEFFTCYSFTAIKTSISDQCTAK